MANVKQQGHQPNKPKTNPKRPSPRPTTLGKGK